MQLLGAPCSPGAPCSLCSLCSPCSLGSPCSLCSPCSLRLALSRDPHSLLLRLVHHLHRPATAGTVGTAVERHRAVAWRSARQHATAWKSAVLSADLRKYCRCVCHLGPTHAGCAGFTRASSESHAG